MENSSVKDFLKFMISSIVDDDSSVVIDEKVDEMGVLYTIKLDKTEAGKIIGKDGQTAKALRLILKIVGYKYKIRASLKVITDED